MATFEAAIPVLLAHEGGCGEPPGDCSTATCFGWTAETCSALGIPMPQDQAEATTAYQKYFWVEPFYSQINSQNTATKLFDDAVNQGSGIAAKMLQRSLCSVGSIVTVDGEIGPSTVAATNAVPEAMLLPWMRLHQYVSYDAWIKENPAREADRLGLARRAAWPDPDGSIAAALLNATYQPPVNNVRSGVRGTDETA